MDDISIYLHIPFCVHRCAYCDFNTYAGLDALIPAYVQALIQEIELLGQSAVTYYGRQAQVHTVFFGGGTPSLLPADELRRVVQALRKHFELLPGYELTMEANPGTISKDYLHEVVDIGINRISLGVQSANTEELRLLERQHGFDDVIRSVRLAREAGLRNLNLDLIFGLPYQELATWQRTLRMACDLQPEHFSLYALTLEHGTPLYHWVQRGLVGEPDSDLAADMYEWACDYLDGCGYGQYEISNWAMDQQLECLHNLQYWRGLPYLGLGAGGHGYANGIRIANILSPQGYIERMKTAESLPFPRSRASANVTQLSMQDEMNERMMMGLRLVDEGVDAEEFLQRFGISLQQAYGEVINKLVVQGLLEWYADRLRLTKPARLLGNRVFMEFV